LILCWWSRTDHQRKEDFNFSLDRSGSLRISKCVHAWICTTYPGLVHVSWSIKIWSCRTKFADKIKTIVNMPPEQRREVSFKHTIPFYTQLSICSISRRLLVSS